MMMLIESPKAITKKRARRMPWRRKDKGIKMMHYKISVKQWDGDVVLRVQRRQDKTRKTETISG